MGRIRKNSLSITLGKDGQWFLQGYILGRQIRRKSPDFGALEAIRLEHEKKINESLQIRVESRITRLTEEELRDAEAAVEIARGRRLVDCVRAAERVLPTGDRKPAQEALAEWLKALRLRKRFEATIKKNKQRVAAFLEYSKVKNLDEITPKNIEAWVFRDAKAAGYTQLTDAAVIRAWLGFCAAGARRWLASNPFEIDTKDLKGSAKPAEKPRILTPAQCWALFEAAREHDGGAMLPYVILSTWCFMRHAEVCRTDVDMIRIDGKTPAVDVNPRKRGTPSYRSVTVPDNMAEALRECVEDMRVRIKKSDADLRKAKTPVEKKKAERKLAKARHVHFSKTKWETIREKAGLIKLGKATRHKRRPILKSVWQDNILRHTGLSYFYQKTNDIIETARQAGDSKATAFRHYINIPKEGDAERFYSKF